MKPRSPLIGFNHNVRHLGRVFHVQTEDSGVGNPHMFTHLFHGGTILSTKRVDYDPDADRDLVRSIMQSQHKAMLRELKQGKVDDKIREYFARRGEPAELEGAGPLESEPEEAPPPPEAREAAESAQQDDFVVAPPPRFGTGPPSDDEGPVITLGPPPPRAVPGASAAPVARASAPALQPDDEPPVITLTPPPRVPTGPFGSPVPAAGSSRPQAEPQAPRPTPAGSTVGRRIWAKKGGAAERPFDDSTAAEAASHSQPPATAASPPGSAIGPARILDVPPGAQGPAGGSLRVTQPRVAAEIRLTPPPVEVPAGAPVAPVPVVSAPATRPRVPSATPGAPLPRVAQPSAPPARAPTPMASASAAAPSDEGGPVVVLAAPPGAQQRRPSAAPTVVPAVPRRRASTPVTTSQPSADGMVVRRPSNASLVSGPGTQASQARAGVIHRPTPTPEVRAAQPDAPSAAVSGVVTARRSVPPPVGVGASRSRPSGLPAREAPSSDSIFGEDLISEKSLDEVILAYLAEDAKNPK